MTARLDLRTSWIRQPPGIMEFTPSDFPTVQQQLENLGITRLRTRFRIEGGEAVRERLHALPSALIRSILHIEK